MEIQTVDHFKVAPKRTYAAYRKDLLPARYMRSFPQAQLDFRLRQIESISQNGVDISAVSDASDCESTRPEVTELAGSQIYSLPPDYLQAICIEAYKWAQRLIEKNVSLGIDLWL